MLLRCFFGIEIVTTFVLCGKQKPFGSAVAFILKLPRIICLSMEFQLLSVPVSHMDTRINGATENSGVYCGHQATSPTDTQTQTCMHVHAHTRYPHYPSRSRGYKNRQKRMQKKRKKTEVSPENKHNEGRTGERRKEKQCQGE